MASRITLSNSQNLFLPFQHPGTLTPSEAATLSIKLLDILAEDPCDAAFLKLISRFLTKETYTELITERNINMRCGYPLCDQQQARAAGRDVYSHESKVSQAMMMPYQYLQSFCSKRHYQASEFYLTQLSDEAVFARDSIGVLEYGKMQRYEGGVTLLEEVLAAYNNSNANNNNNNDKSPSMVELIGNLDSLNLSKAATHDELMESMNAMLGDFKIVENEVVEAPIDPSEAIEGLNDLERYEYLQDQSKAIDGYVLR